MGYKLAGYDVLGCNELDPKIVKVYKQNLHPKYSFCGDIRDFVKSDIPEELFNLDILDGSPPCSSFSTIGNREKDWGKQKQFAEGQKLQRLDDLFFYYIELAKRLRPKVVVAENVRGMLLGHAKGYVLDIIAAFAKAGYEVQLFRLDAATMGVPQHRRRIFFIGRRKDLALPKLNLNFDGRLIPFKEISDETDTANSLTDHYAKEYWEKTLPGHAAAKFKSVRKASYDAPLATLSASRGTMFHPRYKRYVNKREMILASSFPMDYNFLGFHHSHFLGMSVPPVMMAQLSFQIYCQLLKK